MSATYDVMINRTGRIRGTDAVDIHRRAELIERLKQLASKNPPARYTRLVEWLYSDDAVGFDPNLKPGDRQHRHALAATATTRSKITFADFWFAMTGTDWQFSSSQPAVEHQRNIFKIAKSPMSYLNSLAAAAQQDVIDNMCAQVILDQIDNWYVVFMHRNVLYGCPPVIHKCIHAVHNCFGRFMWRGPSLACDKCGTVSITMSPPPPTGSSESVSLMEVGYEKVEQCSQ
jgi:hypothetical protein